MRRSTSRRAPGRRIDRRLLGAAAALVVFGGIIGVTQISSADVRSDAPKKTVNGLQILTDTCADSTLEAHDGFQKGDRCVSTEFGEVGAEGNNPSLLITEAPEQVAPNTPFTLKVSTRNLIRDRFLAAGQGGYYVESSVLTDGGLVRGHFHTACRMLSSTGEANDPAPVPAFFVATEDGRGGGQPDTVSIQVPGMPSEGIAQCASWAGDGSHRIPMMQRANQTPAFDAVRIKVAGGAEEPPPAEEPPAEEPPAVEPPAEEPPATSPATAPAIPPQESPQDDPQDEGSQEQPPVKEQPTTDSSIIKTPPAAEPPPTKAPTKAPTKEATKEATKAVTKAVTAAPTKAPTEPVAAEEPEETQAPAVRKTTRPAPKKSSASPEVLVDNGDDGAPDPVPAAEAGNLIAEPPADDDKGGLALTGSNAMAAVGGGSVLLLIGFVVLSATRRRRPRPAPRNTDWY